MLCLRMAQTNIHDLPVELLTAILTFGDFKDLLLMRQVCLSPTLFVSSYHDHFLLSIDVAVAYTLLYIHGCFQKLLATFL